MNKKVSVIVPVFNTQDYIERCLQSILNQSEKDIEIILVDDFFSDNSYEIINAYAQRYDFIKAFKTKKKGMAGGARNLGLYHATGTFISFIDSDDWIDTEYYSHLIDAIQQKDVDIAICGVRREYENAKCSQVRYLYNVNNQIDGEYALSLLSRVIDQDISISAIVCNKLYYRVFLQKNNLNFLPNSYNEDDIFTFSALLKSQKVAIVSSTNYHLFQRKTSASRSFSFKHIDDLFEAFSIIREQLQSNKKYVKFRKVYYSFFEKCFSYVIESLYQSEDRDEIITEYLKYAYEKGTKVISPNEFIDYCGHTRLSKFFMS